MRSWQTQTGKLVCCWYEVSQRLPYDRGWMQEASQAQGSYLPPTPDFASHSPFGGGTDWFQLHPNEPHSDPGMPGTGL